MAEQKRRRRRFTPGGIGCGAARLVIWDWSFGYWGVARGVRVW